MFLRELFLILTVVLIVLEVVLGLFLDRLVFLAVLVIFEDRCLRLKDFHFDLFYDRTVESTVIDVLGPCLLLRRLLLLRLFL